VSGGTLNCTQSLLCLLCDHWMCYKLPNL